MRAWFGAALILCTGGTIATAQPASWQVSITALRHYAHSACLAQAFPTISDEALAAQAVQQMAERWLRREYPSIRNATLDVVTCIDVSESAELGRLARGTLPR